MFKQALLFLDIPCLHATHANSELLGRGGLTLAPLWLFFSYWHPSRTGAFYPQVQYTGLIHVSGEILKEYEKLYSLILVCASLGLIGRWTRAPKSEFCKDAGISPWKEHTLEAQYALSTRDFLERPR